MRTAANLNQPDWYLALTVGLLLGAALLGGVVARMLHLPRVTAYLLVGLALGPHTPLLGLSEWFAKRFGYSISLSGIHVPAEHLVYLEPAGNFAIALVLFNMGCHFPISSFRRIVKRLLPMSLGELTATMVLVTGGMCLLGILRTDTFLNCPKGRSRESSKCVAVHIYRGLCGKRRTKTGSRNTGSCCARMKSRRSNSCRPPPIRVLSACGIRHQAAHSKH